MATFYVLPSRPALGAHFADFLSRLVPGMVWGSSDWIELGDLLTQAVSSRPEVYVVAEEDLPLGEDVEAALTTGFGARDGDAVIRVRAGKRRGEWHSRSWRLGEGEHVD